jgi:hypothetical protein
MRGLPGGTLVPICSQNTQQKQRALGSLPGNPLFGVAAQTASDFVQDRS